MCGNVFIGHRRGGEDQGSNNLYINQTQIPINASSLTRQIDSKVLFSTLMLVLNYATVKKLHVAAMQELKEVFTRNRALRILQAVFVFQSNY
jgi:hypothetical protein